ncbi:MAG: type II toxin-antitoxin system YafQ family toxin [Rickettsiales bacterium]|nr:type II toxin-antitoxin system YafQ family toxin [Rickettsiales bacterium]
MLEIVRHNHFKKDYKLALKRGKKLKNLPEIIELLCSEKELPIKYRSHKLKGNYQGFWECHIEPDYLLVYDLTPTELHLFRIGTHSDLF